MVVQVHIALERLAHILARYEAMRLQHIADASIEALHHPIGLGRSGLDEPVLNAQLLAQPVKLMVAAGLLDPTGKQPIRELLAVVGQQLGCLDRAGLVQGLQKRLGAGRCLVGLID